MDLTVDFSVMLRNGCLWFIQITIVKTILYNCNVWMLDSVTDSGYLAIDWLEQRGSWNFYSYIKILNLEYVQSSATLVHIVCVLWREDCISIYASRHWESKWVNERFNSKGRQYNNHKIKNHLPVKLQTPQHQKDK